MSKNVPGRIAKAFFRKRSQAVHHAMGRQNEQGRAVHVDERHHDELVGSSPLRECLRCASKTAAAFIAIGERGFVTVVAIGDDSFLSLIVSATEAMTPGSVTCHNRCSTPYSSVTATLARRRWRASDSIWPESSYSIKICPKCARVARSRSSRSALGLARVCSWRKTTPAE